MERKDLIAAVKKLKSSSEKRNFVQSVDVIINLHNLDMKKQQNNVDQFISLHYTRGKKTKVCAIVGPELTDQAKQVCDGVVTAEEMVRAYKDNKKAIRKLTNQYDYFIAQATIMPQIATVFGRVFGPRGKMPNRKAGCVAPPNANLKILYDRLQKLIRVQTKSAPSIKFAAGTEAMSDEELIDNIETVYKSILNAIPSAENSIRDVSVKLTMGKPVKVESHAEEEPRKGRKR